MLSQFVHMCHCFSHMFFFPMCYAFPILSPWSSTFRHIPLPSRCFFQLVLNHCKWWFPCSLPHSCPDSSHFFPCLPCFYMCFKLCPICCRCISNFYASHIFQHGFPFVPIILYSGYRYQQFTKLTYHIGIIPIFSSLISNFQQPCYGGSTRQGTTKIWDFHQDIADFMRTSSSQAGVLLVIQHLHI